jgi:predicted MFS family arabinose efflux permease
MRSSRRLILAVAMVTQGVAIGSTVGTFTLFVEPLERAFVATRSEVSVGNSLIMLALALAGTTVGSFLDRGWARRVMLCGGTLLGSALLLASMATQLWMLGVAAVAAGVAIPMIGPLAGISLVTRAFEEDRGRAMGIVSMGPPLGSGIFAAVVGWVIPLWGWRGGYLLLAGLAFAVVLPLVWLVIPPKMEEKEVESASVRSAPGMKAIARLPVFWLTALVYALIAGIATGWAGQLGPYLGGVGFGERQVAVLLALQFWLGIPGALLFGSLADRLSLTWLFLWILVFQAMVYLTYAFSSMPSWIAGLVIAGGFVAGGMTPLFSLLLGRRVGADALGRAMGLGNLLLLPCTIGSITLASLTYDRTDSYTGALVVFALGLGLAMASLLLSDRMSSESAR